ncbi:MAG TPA: formyltransferase family protein, partial [Gaiella sp.]|nr:formyltransferase family protein [Gaiella sp.]
RLPDETGAAHYAISARRQRRPRRAPARRRGRQVVNTHSAPLPAFPGDHPIEDVLAAGVPETAATIHWVDEGVDTGPVIRHEPVPVEPGDTVESLRARVQAVEHRLLPEVVKGLIAA